MQAEVKITVDRSNQRCFRVGVRLKSQILNVASTAKQPALKNQFTRGFFGRKFKKLKNAGILI